MNSAMPTSLVALWSRSGPSFRVLWITSAVADRLEVDQGAAIAGQLLADRAEQLVLRDRGQFHGKLPDGDLSGGHSALAGLSARGDVQDDRAEQAEHGQPDGEPTREAGH